MRPFLPCISFFVIIAFAAHVTLAQHSVYKGSDNPRKVTIAVSNFEGRSLGEGETATLTDAFRTYIANTNHFRTMERAQMDEIMKEQGFQHSGACTDEACMVEMGQILGVEQIIAGSIGKVGGTYSVNVRLISIKTGEIIKTVNRFHKGEIDGLLTETLPQIADDLTDQGRSAPRPQESVIKRSLDKDDNPKVKKKRRKLTWAITIGTVAAAGGVGAFLLFGKEDDNENPQTGAVEITWETP
ncbi:MAG: hypothetical protein GF401_21100 [Chitinivibrionales bacterium]|nr:hypothetical protein [Chitinivibrionales bacterium]